MKSGLIVGEQPTETHALVTALRERTEKPLVVKLTPNTADPAAVAVAAEEAGADGVSLINTLRATGLAPGSAEPWLGAGSGGLSGPAVRAIALEQVRRVAAAVSIAVIGMGGIETASGRGRVHGLGGRSGRCRDRELPRSGGRNPGPGRPRLALATTPRPFTST